MVARIAPVLVFLIAVTVIAELADKAKLFEVAAREAAHLARGRVWRLWLLVVALATGLTIVLSLDTCAVLLTYRSYARSGTILRSSLWVLDNGRWRLRFHQGTPEA